MLHRNATNLGFQQTAMAIQSHNGTDSGEQLYEDNKLLKPLNKDKYLLRQIYRESLSSNSLTKIPRFPTELIFKQNFSSTENVK